MSSWDHLALATQAEWAMLAGDATLARRTLRDLRRHAERGTPAAEVAYRLGTGLLALRSGDPRTAAAQGGLALDAAQKSGLGIAEGHCLLLKGLGLSRSGDAQGLADVRRSARMGRAWRNPYLEAMAFRALSAELLRLGERHEAHEGMAHGLRLSRDHGLWFNPWLTRAEEAPVCAEALDRDIQRDSAIALIRALNLEPPPRAWHLEGWPGRSQVQALGPLRIVAAGTLPPAGKPHRRSFELLGALIAAGRGGVPADVLARELWPDSSPTSARRALRTALHRLRGLFRDPQSVAHSDGRLAIDPGRVFVDAWAVEAFLDELERGTVQPDRSEALKGRLRALWRGDLLPDDPSPKAAAVRRKLAARVGRALGLPADDGRLAYASRLDKGS